ncbi:MAG: serine/threonine-protein kinase [Acidimicrobiales bacterium]
MPGVVTAGRVVDDRYRLIEVLDEGGMGILWRAEDLISEREVTVKELRFPDPLDHMQRRALAARVRREARAMAAVRHPGLARIVDVVDDGDRPWVVTELVDAPTLADVVRGDGPMDPEHAALLGIRLLDVLEAATDQEMVHRFLQPSKVYVGPSGEVRLADFGIASLIGDPTVARSGAVGGVSFMSPEQSGTAEADIWSLGAVLYYAVEGVAPFEGENSTSVLEAVASDPPRPARLAGPLSRVIELTLQKDPSERPSADELRTLMEVAAGALAPHPAPEPSPDDDAILWADAGNGSHLPTDAPPVDTVTAVPTEEADADAAVEPAEVEEPPPAPPLPPRVALARMFSPAPGSPPAVFTLEEEHREPAPPWPVPRRRSTWTIAVCAAVMLVLVAILATNGREIFTSEGRNARIVASVDWSEYVDPATGFRIDFPTDWRVSREGNYTDFRHPESAAALRVVVQDSNNRSAEAGWLDLERRFRAEQTSYSRLRLEATKFRGYSAAEWEFTYIKQDVQLHNLDLGVVTGAKAFTLNFEARAVNWPLVQAFMDRFESSFRPPAT